MQRQEAFSVRRVAFGIFFAGIVVALIYMATITAPANAQDTQDCANPTEVDSSPFTGTQNDTVGPFNITGDEFRVTATYQSEDADATLDITVVQNNQVTDESFTVSDSGDSEIVTRGPGNFQLQIEENENISSFTVTVEDCAGSNGDDGAGGDQYDDNGDDDVINVPDKDLPKTGGLPLLGILFGVTAGAGLLTAVVRRRR